MSCTENCGMCSTDGICRSMVEILDLTMPSLEQVHEICKSDRIIGGYASVCVPDKQRDLFPADTLRRAAQKYLTREGGRWRNLMIQHQSVQIGEVLPSYKDSKGREWKTQVDDIGLFVVARITKNHVFADEVWKRIEDGDLDSFSIRGVGTSWKYVGGESPHKVITDLDLYEVTVCSAGINPYAKFQVIKSFSLKDPLSIAQEWAYHGHADKEGAKWPFCLANIEMEEKKNLSEQELSIPQDDTEEVGVEAIDEEVKDSDPVLDAIGSLGDKLSTQIESLTKAIEDLKLAGQIEFSRKLPTPSQRKKARRRLTCEPRKPKVGRGIIRADKKPEASPYPEDKYPKPKEETEELTEEEKAKKKPAEYPYPEDKYPKPKKEDEEKAKKKPKEEEEEDKKAKKPKDEEEEKKEDATVGPEEIKEMIKAFLDERFPVEKKTKVPVTGEVTGSNRILDLLKMDNESFHKISWEELDRIAEGEA